jgi:hypothetical protein
VLRKAPSLGKGIVMDMEIYFPGNKRVYANCGGFVLELGTPVGFPDKYRDAVVNAMNLCAVKKHLSRQPSFVITTVAG